MNIRSNAHASCPASIHRVLLGLCISLSACLAVAQDDPGRTVPGSPAPAEPSEQKDWNSPDIVHPTPFGANSRDLNNIDPTIVPFEGGMPGPLGSQSREIQSSPGGTGPTVFIPGEILNGNSRSVRGRPVGTIYQMPDGQLRFVMRSTSNLWHNSRDDQSFKGGKRGADAGNGTEKADPPVMVGGGYNKPLGRPSREDLGESGIAISAPVVPIEMTVAEMAALPALASDSETEVSEYEEKAAFTEPSALSAGSRAFTYQVVHFRNMTKFSLKMRARWGMGKWDEGVLKPGQDYKSWFKETSKGTPRFVIEFDNDPGPGFNRQFCVVPTHGSHTTLLNGKPTDVFFVHPTGQISWRKIR